MLAYCESLCKNKVFFCNYRNEVSEVCTGLVEQFSKLLSMLETQILRIVCTKKVVKTIIKLVKVKLKLRISFPGVIMLVYQVYIEKMKK